MRSLVVPLALVLAGCGFDIRFRASGDDAGPPGDGSGNNDAADGALPDAAPPTRRCTLGLGSDHSCVLRMDGTVWCWGQNAFGELGQGASPSSPTALQVTLGMTATSFATKSYHACAGLQDGSVKCWGLNDSNQIGDGIVGNRLTPATVANLAQVTQVAVGRAHSCALRTSGAVTCWGSNTSGQLGDGGYTPKTTPTSTVGGLSSVPLSITLASSHACALLASGEGQCWGDNAYRQLGDGSNIDRTSATAMPVASIQQIAPSGYSVTPYTGGATCALATTGTVTCWGSNDFGQLGNGTTSTMPTSTPVQVQNLTDAVELVAGRYHVCARRAGGAVVCWGRNDFGQIGDGTNNTRSSPSAVTLPRPAVHVGTGGWHTCALLDDSSLYCWGANSAGQLGDGSTTGRTMPVASQTICQ